MRSVRSFFLAFAVICFVIAESALVASMPIENIRMEGITIVKDSRGTTVSGKIFASDGKAMPAMAILIRLEDRKGKEIDTVIVKVPAIPVGGAAWVTGTNSIRYDSVVQVTLLGYAISKK